MPCRWDQSRQRSAAKAPSPMSWRKLGHWILPASRAGSTSRSPGSSPRAGPAHRRGPPPRPASCHRRRPAPRACAPAPPPSRGQALLPGVIPAWPAHRQGLDRLRVDDGETWSGPTTSPSATQARHLTQQAVEQAQVEPAPEPAIHRAPSSCTRMGGMPGGSRRQLPPTRRHQVIAPTTGKTGVAVPLRGGSARSSQRGIVPTAHVDSTCFKFASWRARCCVHISPPPARPGASR